MQEGTGPLSAGIDEKESKSYRCAACKSVITYADRLVDLLGKSLHRCKYSPGVFCELFTFSSCPGAFNIGEPNEYYSWFPGYGWSFAVCRKCGNHLGWRYKATPRLPEVAEFIGIEQFPEFWGIMARRVYPHEDEIKEPIA
jgi:DNA-directed RNA polymerase subunit RPC12/RpoP